MLLGLVPVTVLYSGLDARSYLKRLKKSFVHF